MSIVVQGHTPVQAVISGTLLDTVSGNTNGSWQRLDRITPWSFVIRGTFVATVTIYVSNQTSKPADADNTQGPIIAVTGPFADSNIGPYLWIKAVVTSYASGSITVDFSAGR